MGTLPTSSLAFALFAACFLSLAHAEPDNQPAATEDLMLDVDLSHDLDSLLATNSFAMPGTQFCIDVSDQVGLNQGLEKDCCTCDDYGQFSFESGPTARRSIWSRSAQLSWVASPRSARRGLSNRVVYRRATSKHLNFKSSAGVQNTSVKNAYPSLADVCSPCHKAQAMHHLAAVGTA